MERQIQDGACKNGSQSTQEEKSGKSEWVRVGLGGERVWLGVWLFTCGDILGLYHRENKFEHMDNQF